MQIETVKKDVGQFLTYLFFGDVFFSVSQKDFPFTSINEVRES